MKTCTKCGETKPVSEFGRDARNKDSLRSNCKACRKIEKAAWYANNREKSLSYSAAWATANPDKVRARNAAWYAANRDRKAAYHATWAAANRESMRIHFQNRRASQYGGKLSSGLAARLFKLQRGKCACCGLPLGDDYHLDHIMPIALGGTNTDDNIQLLRSTCNHKKHAKHPIDFMRSKGYLL